MENLFYPPSIHFNFAFLHEIRYEKECHTTYHPDCRKTYVTTYLKKYVLLMNTHQKELFWINIQI